MTLGLDDLRTAPVLFDCDGVLVGMHAAEVRAYTQLIADVGTTLSLPQCLRDFRGAVAADVFAILDRDLQAQGRPVLTEEFKTHGAKQFRGFADDAWAIIPGMPDLIGRLHLRGRTQGVASNSRCERLHGKLKRFGYSYAFNGSVFSKDCVGKPKPAPDLILHAAAMMGLDLAQTVFVDDSACGAQAGVKAGCGYVIGFPVECPDLDGLDEDFGKVGVDQVVRSVEELEGLLLG